MSSDLSVSADMIATTESDLARQVAPVFIPCRVELALLNLSNTLDRTVASQLLGWVHAKPPTPALTPAEAFPLYIAIAMHGRARTILLGSIARRETFDRDLRARQALRQARAQRAAIAEIGGARG